MRTQDTLERICEALQHNCGDDLDACRQVGVSLIFLNQWCKDDKLVREKITEAKHVGTQGLVSAAIQRGVYGTEEDVYYRGEVVGHKRNYSDGLLQSLLKAKVPEFAKDGETGTSVTVNVANIMPRADSHETWLQMKQKTMNALAEAEAIKNGLLPAPVQDAEYSEVTPFDGIDL